MHPLGWPMQFGSPLSQQVAGPPPTAPSPYPNSKRQGRMFEVQGIAGRIYHLRDLIKKSLLDVDVSRQLALGITAACPRRDDRCEMEALWHFMHGRRPNALPNVRYTGDLGGYDTYQTARTTLLYGGGDCDDGAILVVTLGVGNQFPVKCRITQNPGGDGWAHIYPLFGLPKHNPRAWLPFDWTLGWHYFGAHPPQGKFVEFDGERIVYSPGEIKPDDYQGW